MEYTRNYRLKKPAQTDYYDVDDFNSNADIIDEAMGNIPRAVYNSERKAIEFTGGIAVGGSEGHGGEGSYVLGAAGKDRLGGVRIGSGIDVDTDGTISLNQEAIVDIIEKNVVDITPEEIRTIFMGD